MATNLQINTTLLEEAQKIGGFRTKRETVDQALDEFIKRRKRLQLLELQNQIDYFPDYDYKAGRLKR
jgi:hypothetical protein